MDKTYIFFDVPAEVQLVEITIYEIAGKLSTIGFQFFFFFV